MNTYQSANGNKIIRIQPSGMCKTYGAVFRYDNNTTIHFELELSCLQEMPGGRFLFELNRKQVYINEQAPDKVADRLSDDLGKVVYPLQVITDYAGTVIKLANIKDIQQRWSTARAQIEQYYTGDIVQQAIDAMDMALDRDTQVFNAVKNDFFIALFFSGIYSLDHYDFRELTGFLLPVIPYGPPVKYAVTREITAQHTESKCLIVCCKGDVGEKRSIEDILKKNPAPLYHALHGQSTPASGNLYVEYKLYHEDFSIRSVIGRCTLDLPGDKEKVVAFEIYHIPEKDKPFGQKEESIIVEDTPKPPKRFWSLFK